MPPSAHATSRWQEIQKQLGRRLAGKLFNDMSQWAQGSDRSTTGRQWSWSLAAAYALAAGIHVTSLALVAIGIGILSGSWPWPVRFAATAFCLLMAWICLPRRAKPPAGVVPRSDLPHWYALADRLADAMQAPRIDGIAISADFNANFRTSGWRGRHYVEIGMPLLAVLTPHEQSAVLAHELSHGANKDPLRGQFLFGAVNSVVQWAQAIRPLSLGSAGQGLSFGPLISLVAIPIELVLLAASELLLLFAKGMLLLVLRESQRAEYLADRLAGSVSGARHLASALEKLYLAEHVAAAVRQHALTGAQDRLMPKLEQAVLQVPASEMAALRQQSREMQWQVDSTHPPTAMRVEFLSLCDYGSVAPLQIEPNDAQGLKADLDRLANAVERELVNRHMEQIYG